MATLRVGLLVGLALAASCSGDHTLGVDSNELASRCCYLTATGQKVASCTGLNDCYCDGTLCNRGPSCRADADCPPLGVPCRVCSDGSTACPQVSCVAGICKATIHTCPPPACNPALATPTRPEADCIVPNVCISCSDGSKYESWM